MSGRTDSVADAQSHSLFIYIMKSELRLSISSVLCMSGAILISLSSASRGRNRNKLREIGKHSPSTNGSRHKLRSVLVGLFSAYFAELMAQNNGFDERANAIIVLLQLEPHLFQKRFIG